MAVEVEPYGLEDISNCKQWQSEGSMHWTDGAPSVFTNSVRVAHETKFGLNLLAQTLNNFTQIKVKALGHRKKS